MPRQISAIPRWLDPGAVGLWLDRRRVRAAAAILLAIELAIFAFVIAGTHGWIVRLPQPTTTDFVSFYAAGALADAGTPALAYDRAAHLAAEEAVAGNGIEYQFFNYPPVFLLLCAALAPLPYLAAFMLFEAATLALLLAVATRILDDRSGTALVVLLAVPVVFWNFGLGQNGFLTAALFGAAMLLIDRRPVLAGVLLGALCYKPQFGILVPLALAAGGRWRTFAAAGLAVAGLVLLSLALFGAETWQAFLAAAAASPGTYQSGRIRFAGMANVFGGSRLLGVATPVAYVMQAAASLGAAALVVIVWRRSLSLSTRAAVLTAAALVAAPLALLYDLVLGALAACWIVRDAGAPAGRAWERTALAGLYLLLALLGHPGVAAAWQLPVFPLAALALLVLAGARAWREMAGDVTAGTGSLPARTGENRAAAAERLRSASPPR
jgi:hypothetical protein